MKHPSVQSGKNFASEFKREFPKQMEQDENKDIISDWQTSDLLNVFDSFSSALSVQGMFTSSTFIFKDTKERVRVLNSLIVNNSTGTVYLVIFEAPDPNWEQMWKKCGQYMLSNLMLLPDS